MDLNEILGFTDKINIDLNKILWLDKIKIALQNMYDSLIKLILTLTKYLWLDKINIDLNKIFMIR